MPQTIAILGDLHGNLPATLAMEQALQATAPDAIWFLGDAVGKGPDSPETCDWVRAHCDRFVGGNWDYGIGNKQFRADGYYWDQLGPERMAWLASLPSEMDAWISGIHFRLFHGRPVTGLLKVDDSREDLAATFRTEDTVYTGVIFADSHRPFLRTLHEGYILNTGSVGNSMGVPRAHCLLITGEMDSQTSAPLQMNILSVPYDNEAAAEAARQSPDLPRQEAYIREVLTGVYSR